MRLEPLGLRGAWIIEPDPHRDHRGHFARVFDRNSFRDHGIRGDFQVCALSYNRKAQTLRGLHFQRAPHGEAKLVRCVRGRLFDVVVDLRGGSQTFLQWRGVELSEESMRAVYLPRGCAHGFLTLEENTVVDYAIDAPEVPGAAAGLRWDDPRLAIQWPTSPEVISERDASYVDVADLITSGVLPQGAPRRIRPWSGFNR